MSDQQQCWETRTLMIQMLERTVPIQTYAQLNVHSCAESTSRQPSALPRCCKHYFSVPRGTTACCLHRIYCWVGQDGHCQKALKLFDNAHMNLYCNHSGFGLMLRWECGNLFTVNSRSNWCGQYIVLGVSCPQIGMPSVFYFKINNVFNPTRPKLATASLASPSSQTLACISLPAQSQLSSCILKPKHLNLMVHVIKS